MSAPKPAQPGFGGRGGAKRRFLLPKEHGAYAELGFPLLTVLLLGVPGLGTVALSLAVVCLFLMHEPALVLLGHRGTRLQREAGGLAMRLVSALALAGLGFGCAGLWLSPWSALWGALVPIAFVIALLPMTATRREKTLPGELLAAAALVAGSVPVALSASITVPATATVSIVWGVTFALGTLAVRLTVMSAKAATASLRTVTLLLTLGTVLAAVWLSTLPEPPSRAALAVLPGAILALALTLFRIPPRRLRIVGWSIAVSNLMTLALLLLLL